jgi:hypothetical protein
MATDITFDTKSLEAGIKSMTLKFAKATHQGLIDVANEVLRLSQREVPHDTGLLQNSGHVEETNNELDVLVGYNKVYAARMHEHPEYHFQKGRKGKYLEDPIKMNTPILEVWMGEAMKRNINI